MSTSQLEQECRSYSQYLVGQIPSEYLVRKYVDFHSQSRQIIPADSFDRFLTNVAARSPFWAGLTDAYASRFRKSSAVRKKVVLTLALLECTPPWFEYLDGAGRESILLAIGILTWRAAMYSATLAVSAFLFLPVQMWTAVFERSGKVPPLERWTQS